MTLICTITHWDFTYPPTGENPGDGTLYVTADFTEDSDPKTVIHSYEGRFPVGTTADEAKAAVNAAGLLAAASQLAVSAYDVGSEWVVV